jgi:NAD-dependent dihydropyrimidine dehydrogenase PreA subunit
MAGTRKRWEVLINEARCRGCDVCIDLCPTDVLVPRPPRRIAQVARLEACTGCRFCEWLCPDWAITVRAVATVPEGAEP